MLVAAGSVFAQQQETAVVAAPESDGVEIGAQIGFESHYVYRGIELGDENTQTTVNVGYVLGGSSGWGFKAYGEVFYMSPISSEESNEIDWKLATRAIYEEEYFFDLGYTFKTYPDSHNVNRSNEVFFGIGRDVELVRDADWSRIIIAGTVSYDWNYEQTSWEIYAEKTFEEVGTDELDLRVRVNYGYITSSDWNGDQKDWNKGSPDEDYGYCSASVDAIYHLTEATDISLGMRYAYNNSHERRLENGDVNHSVDCNEFWWGASVTFRY